MRRFTLLIFILFAYVGAFAQNISVADFHYAENDLTARTHGTSVEDQNGNICALIKVKTTERGNWAFDVGMLGVRRSEEQNATHPAEIWVYVPFGVTWMSIQHDKLGELDHYRFPCSIDKGCTYVMKLTTGKVITIVEEEVRQQYLLFQLDPPNAILEVDDKLWSVEADGTAMKYVDFGTYNYRVRASDYATEVGKVTVDDPNNTKIVSVKLKSNLAEVTLKVDADAEIWVNNRKKGVRTWTGKLGNGTYKIECKQNGHETTMVSKEITTEMNGETITLPAPTPIYGSLMVESTPNLCKLYIDGKDYGTTPKSVNNILVGQHEIRLTKDGYDEYKETITIAKGERKQVKATLEVDGSALIAVKPQQPEIKQPAPVKPESNVFFVMANAAYSLAPQTSFGLTLGSVKRWGWYASVGSNFKFASAGYDCDADGTISSDANNYYHYTKKETMRLSVAAGAVARMYKPICAYFGAGYGLRNLLWHFEGNNVSGVAKNTAYSHEGVALDAGMMFHLGHFSGSLGVQTVNFGYVEAKLGLGMNF